jgi:2-iminoacetate synthase ThiH
VAQSVLNAASGAPAQPSNGRLTSVDAYITSQCNRRCTYCFLPADFFSSGARMSMDLFAGVVAWSQRHGVGEMTLLGGEPAQPAAFCDRAALRERGIPFDINVTAVRPALDHVTVASNSGECTRVAPQGDQIIQGTRKTNAPYSYL